MSEESDDTKASSDEIRIIQKKEESVYIQKDCDKNLMRREIIVMIIKLCMVIGTAFAILILILFRLKIK